MPLVVQDRVVGVMDLESDRVGYFTDDHVRTLALLAPQVASSVENARLYQELATRERRMEEDLQGRARAAARAAAGRRRRRSRAWRRWCACGRRARISGDIYDVFERRDGQTVIAFGDVSGKGAAAALYGGLMSGLLRTLAPRRRRPAELMRALNEALIERKVEARYVTLCVLLWDPATRQIVMANAGALPPMICRAGRDPQAARGGRAAGPAGRARIRRGRPFEAEPGDVIVLYSDGITDHLNAGRHRIRPRPAGACGAQPLAGPGAATWSPPFSATWTSFPPRRSTIRRCW